MDNQTKKEGQKYSNNVIDSIQTTLNKLNSNNDDLYEEGYEELFDCLGITKHTVINYLISWGGPSYRLQITFNEDNELVSIKPQFQDWFTYWETMETTEEQDNILEEYVERLALEEILLNE
tara:strand:- start:1376 stop:1738 length:363 start_codon:yes stop_codon:yes gene_type:complete